MKNHRLLTLLLSRSAMFAVFGVIAAILIVIVASAQVDRLLSKDDRNSEETLKRSSLKPVAPAPRPTGAEQDEMAAELMRLANKSTDGLKLIKRPDGSASMEMKDRFQNVAVARVDSDGSVSTSCFDEPEAAAKFVGVDPRKVGANKSAKTKKSVDVDENGLEVK